ncbi:alpha-D-glucose-1-phosphate phosphatase YihX [Favolaschia claudopus]|uniref:Alpha-D-glucose-1-phosphate phosphatase YihX n=1 Tax=Favolaschia claudopus TaxID=2862362 RepID=A0AAW0EKN8_9AGAR
MSANPSFDTIILNDEDLFACSNQIETIIPRKMLRRIFTSLTWFDYERGKLSQTDCYDRLVAEFGRSTEDIHSAITKTRESLRLHEDLVTLLLELKQQSNGKLRVFTMTNLSVPDCQELKHQLNWSIFDRVFTSAEAGERKPHLGFYKYVIEAGTIDSRRTIFVDTEAESVLTARSLGLYGMVLSRDNITEMRRSLHNLLGNPVARANRYLERTAGNLQSVSDTGVVLKENFAQLLILELTGNKYLSSILLVIAFEIHVRLRNLVDIVEYPRAWNFFHGKGVLTTESYPFDFDTTAVALTVLERDKEVIKSVMDEMLEYIDSDGIILTYFDRRRGQRIDPVVCVNVLNLFYKFHRESEMRPTLEWIKSVLRNRAYLDGTRYYANAECFLFFVVRLLLSTDNVALHGDLTPLLKERLQERIGIPGDAAQLAMRIIACASVGLRDDLDLSALLKFQCEDGSFELSWTYRYPSSGIKIGNRGLTTALAIKAIESAKSLKPMIATV